MVIPVPAPMAVRIPPTIMFTMKMPYEMNYDLAGGESTTFSFTDDTVGTFTYYCTYDLPSMIGQPIVLP